MHKAFEIIHHNQTKDSSISMKHVIHNAIFCRSTWSRVRGLMFSMKKTLVFPFSQYRLETLHMLFVFFPIEALYLDSKKKVLEKGHLFPFGYYHPKHKCRYIVEIPRKTNIKVGDVVTFK